MKLSEKEFKEKYCGSTSKKEPQKYTGNNMLGIGTMHKSNAVPIFSVEAAKNLSGMRR